MKCPNHPSVDTYGTWLYCKDCVDIQNAKTRKRIGRPPFSAAKRIENLQRRIAQLQGEIDFIWKTEITQKAQE